MKREYDFSNAKHGPVIPAPKRKKSVTIRLDEGVVAWLRSQVEKAGGGNYQTLMNDALRQYIARARGPLAETLRRVIKEETRPASWFDETRGGAKGSREAEAPNRPQRSGQT
jgi:hypothetical protein